MTRRHSLLLALALFVLPVTAHAAGSWSTWFRMRTAAEVIGCADTVGWRPVRPGPCTSAARAPSNTPASGPASNTLARLRRPLRPRLAATPQFGVSRLSADRATWDLVNAFDGLPSDTVNVLRADGDTVWIGTQRGIALFDGTQIAGSVPTSARRRRSAATTSPASSSCATSLFVSTSNGIYVARLSQQLSTWASMDAGLLSTKRAARSRARRTQNCSRFANGATHRWSMTTHTWAIAGAGLREAHARRRAALLDLGGGHLALGDERAVLQTGSPARTAARPAGGSSPATRRRRVQLGLRGSAPRDPPSLLCTRRPVPSATTCRTSSWTARAPGEHVRRRHRAFRRRGVAQLRNRLLRRVAGHVVHRAAVRVHAVARQEPAASGRRTGSSASSASTTP